MFFILYNVSGGAMFGLGEESSLGFVFGICTGRTSAK